MLASRLDSSCSRLDRPPSLLVGPSFLLESPALRLDGTGVTQALSGYAPGTWWIRAAPLRSKGKSSEDLIDPTHKRALRCHM